MSALRDAALWLGAGGVALGAHVGVGLWMWHLPQPVGEAGLVLTAMPVEIALEAPLAQPPQSVSDNSPAVAEAPPEDAPPDLAMSEDAAPPLPVPDLAAPSDMAESAPQYDPPPPAPQPLPPDLSEPAVAPAPAPPDIAPAFTATPPPDAVVLPLPQDMAPPDMAEALPRVQPPPDPPPAPETTSESAVAIALRPESRPDRPQPPAPTPQPAPASPAPAAAAPAATPAPPPPAAPSAGEMQSWQDRAVASITRHMSRTRISNLRGQVQASLTLTVSPSGAVSARIAASTGKADADAALARQAGSIPTQPPPPSGQSVTFVLPVAIAGR